MWSACFTSCATNGREDAQGISAEAQRRFDYYYAEAVKSKLAGVDVLSGCINIVLDIKPGAAGRYTISDCIIWGWTTLPDARPHLSIRSGFGADNIYYKGSLPYFYLHNPG